MENEKMLENQDLKDALENITYYKNEKEFEKCENLTPDEFQEQLDSGFIQDLTCGVYNGATESFSPWELTKINLMYTLYNAIADYREELDVILEAEGRTNLTENRKVRLFTEYFKVFTLNGRVYVDMD